MTDFYSTLPEQMQLIIFFIGFSMAMFLCSYLFYKFLDISFHLYDEYKMMKRYKRLGIEYKFSFKERPVYIPRSFRR